jgi:hypothetical protein
MIPAVSKMVEALGQTENPYGDLMKIINQMLKLDASEHDGRRPLQRPTHRGLETAPTHFVESGYEAVKE